MPTIFLRLLAASIKVVYDWLLVWKTYYGVIWRSGQSGWSVSKMVYFSNISKKLFFPL